LAEIKTVPATLIFYETGPRLAESLVDMQAVLGDRPAAVARELTKKFEEVQRGSLSTLIKHYQASEDPRGEIVVVVGAPVAGQEEDWSDEAIDKLLLEMMDEQGEGQGMSVKDASAFVAAKSGLKKRDVYQRALMLKQKNR
jgi:16S rRNA (cytidine1402-2'-O)-methyltransferase